MIDLLNLIWRSGMNDIILKIGTNLRFDFFFFTLHVILKENA